MRSVGSGQGQLLGAGSVVAAVRARRLRGKEGNPLVLAVGLDGKRAYRAISLVQTENRPDEGRGAKGIGTLVAG